MNSFFEKIKNLPICSKLDELQTKIESSNIAILNSAPGSGKSTVVPIFLLKKILENNEKIIMLEPRKLAAKMAACRMADLLGENVGESVGYIFKGEKAVSAQTRIEVVTEGVFTKIIQSDPFLTNYRMVIFDEFHERNINSDLGLAFSLDVQKNLRSDLKILLMSGSLNSADLADKLEAETIFSEERRYELEINYLNAPIREIDLEVEVCRRVLEICRQNELEGDILVFLSGAYEINKIADKLGTLVDTEKIVIYRLYGAMDKKSQDQAVNKDPFGRRKIILSTNISESSVTILNVNFVIDSGREKRLIYDTLSALNRLTELPISQSSAIQRANRAGRMGRGVVYRLYSERDYRNFSSDIVPEIEEIELSDFALELAIWGSSFDKLFFLVKNSIIGKLEQAYEFLQESGILDEKLIVTPFGRKVYANSTQLRYGIMIEKAKLFDLEVLACEVAALLSENIIDDSNLIDCEIILENMRRHPRESYTKELKQLLNLNHLTYKKISSEYVGLVIAFAYFEFIGKKRSNGTYLLANGFGCRLKKQIDSLENADFLAVAKLDRSNQANGVIHLAAEIKLSDLERVFPDKFTTEKVLEYSEAENRFFCLNRRCFQKIVLSEKISNDVDESLLQQKIGQLLDVDLLNYFNLTNKDWGYYQRISFAYQNDSDNFPDFSFENLKNKIKEYIFSSNINLMTLNSLKKLDFSAILSYSISMTDKKLLDKLYPEYYLTPCGSKIMLEYGNDEIILRVKMTEMYGVKIHPTVGIKKIPLKIELLSPANRVIQITGDLPDFWQNNYEYVRKEMRSKYIKHFWPDDPMEAVPTKKIKNKM